MSAVAFLCDVTIEPAAGDSGHIFLSQPLYNIWNLASSPYITLKCGTNQEQVGCVPGNYDDTVKLTCDPALLQKFHLPAAPLPLRISYDLQSEVLDIGPIIAILTLLRKSAFDGPLLAYCEELARYSEKQHVLFYVFTLKDWRQDNVIGYAWRHNHWDRREFPRPHVIHNRIGQRKLEQLQATGQFFDSLSENKIAIFNARFLDKWEVYEKLAVHPELAPYLPETVLFRDKHSLETMVQAHACIFLKPAAGSQGKRIFRIHRRADHFELDYSTFSHGIKRQYAALDELYTMIEGHLHRQRYIIQQGLPLIEHNGRPLDFRMLVNKGRSGDWKITSGVARVSSEEQFVSNLARGGAAYSVQTILEEVFPKKHALQIRKLFGELALEIANTLSLEAEGHYGELGVDLAIDQQGKPWMIEVNTKPSKDLDSDREPTVIRPSAKAVIQYGCFLAGFA
ncbi:MAG TPA: YheC/YheD family protein [Bacillales bacterium]|nr:YheC/YheD family protein [Bacillales bacterium]